MPKKIPALETLRKIGRKQQSAPPRKPKRNEGRLAAMARFMRTLVKGRKKKRKTTDRTKDVKHEILSTKALSKKELSRFRKKK